MDHPVYGVQFISESKVMAGSLQSYPPPLPPRSFVGTLKFQTNTKMRIHAAYVLTNFADLPNKGRPRRIATGKARLGTYNHPGLIDLDLSPSILGWRVSKSEDGVPRRSENLSVNFLFPYRAQKNDNCFPTLGISYVARISSALPDFSKISFLTCKGNFVL